MSLFSCPTADSAESDCTSTHTFSGGSWVKDDRDYASNPTCCLAIDNGAHPTPRCTDNTINRCPAVKTQDLSNVPGSSSYASSTGFMMLTWKPSAWSAFNAGQSGGGNVAEPEVTGPDWHTQNPLVTAGFSATLRTTKWDGYHWRYDSSPTGDAKSSSGVWREAHAQTAWEYGSYTPRWKSYLNRTSANNAKTEADFETQLGPRVTEPFFPRSSGLETPRATQDTIDIMLLPLQSSCAFGNITRDHLFFSDEHGPGGEPGNALWTDDLVRDPIDTISLLLPTVFFPSKTLTEHNRHLKMFAAATTEANRDYIFSFQIMNPVMSQVIFRRLPLN